MDIQPVVLLVNTKLALPNAKPVTTPLFVTEATAGLLLTQVPPVAGDKVVVLPIQIEAGPLMLTTGLGRTSISPVTELQPVAKL